MSLEQRLTNIVSELSSAKDEFYNAGYLHTASRLETMADSVKDMIYDAGNLDSSKKGDE